MKKWRRRIVISCAVVVGVVLLAAVLVPLLVPAERWKAMALERVEAETGLAVSAGEAGISFPWPLGFRLDDITIEDPEGVTGLESFRAQAQDLVVTAQIGPLLRGKIHVDEIILRRPNIELTLAAEGETGTNESAEGEEAPSGGSSAGASAVLGLLSVEDGQVLIHDGSGGTTALRGLQNQASLTTEAGDVRGEFSGKLGELSVTGGEAAEPLVLADLAWKGRFDALQSGQAGQLELEEFSLAGLRAAGSLAWDQSEKTIESDWTIEGQLDELFRGFVQPRLVLPTGWSSEDLRLGEGAIRAELAWNSRMDASPEQMVEALRGNLEWEETNVGLLGDSDFASLRGRGEIADGSVSLRMEPVRAPGTSGRIDVVSDLLARQPIVVQGEARVLAEPPVTWAREHWSKLAALAGPDAAAPDGWPAVAGSVDLRFEVRVDSDAGPDAVPAVDFRVMPRRLAVLPATMADSLFVQGGTLAGNMEELRVEDLRLTGPGLDGTGRLRVQSWSEAPRISGDVQLVRLDLDALQSAQKPMETASLRGWSWGPRVAHAAPPEATLPAPPPEMEADVRVRAEQVTSAGWRVEGVEGNLRLDDQRLELPDLRGRMGTGTVDVQAAMDWNQTPPRWTTSAQAQSIPASELLNPVAAPLARALQAELSGDFALSGAYQTDIAQLLQGLTGDVDLSSGGGLIETTSLLGGRVAEFLGRQASSWKELRFRALDAGLRVEGGRVHFDRFLLEGETQVRVAGSVALDGQADYRLDVLLPPGSTPELGSLEPVADLLRDESGRFAFGVNVAGPAASPKVEIDFADLQERARQAGEDAARDKVRDALDDLGSQLEGQLKGEGDQDVKDAVGGLLDRLRKGGKKEGGGGEGDEKEGEEGGGG